MTETYDFTCKHDIFKVFIMSGSSLGANSFHTKIFETIGDNLQSIIYRQLKEFYEVKIFN